VVHVAAHSPRDQDENDGGKLSGDVEVDETYIGGKARNMHYTKRRMLMESTLDQRGNPSKKNRWAGKQPVLGILERGSDGTSRIRTKTIPDVRQHRLHREIVENIEEGSTVYTDDLHSYKNMPLEYEHQFVNHASEYARGNVHTNGLESYWSLLKRALSGTYVSVEPFHLFRYLDEQAFRFNNRKLNDAQRFVLAIAGIIGKRLTYAELIAADAGTV
jgi:transposase-like protein